MTSPSPKAIAEYILDLVNEDVDLWHADSVAKHTHAELQTLIAEQVKLAMEQERNDVLEAMQGEPERYWKEKGIAEQERRCGTHCKPLYEQAYAEGFTDGQVAMREMCAKVSETYSSNDELLYEAFTIVAEKIRAIEPKAPMGEGTARI